MISLFIYGFPALSGEQPVQSRLGSKAEQQPAGGTAASRAALLPVLAHRSAAPAESVCSQRPVPLGAMPSTWDDFTAS
jgi:hypothetical protein